MQKPYLSKAEIYDFFEQSSWQHVVFKEFDSTLQSDVRPFPCVFGVTGLRQNQLRFVFSETMQPEDIAVSLRHFVIHSHTYGPNTSLVVFSRPRPVASLKTYEKQFWNLLRNLAALDAQQWPNEIPLDMDTPRWEFCFAGEPIFVVCNTPAHVERQSRRSATFMITFQPRWIFDKILATSAAANAATGAVRRRLEAYDIAAPSKHLGAYGNPEVREFKQYFLTESDQPTSCPFRSLTKLDNEGSDVA